MTQYAIITNTISKYDEASNKYFTVAELKKLIETGSDDYDEHTTFGAVYDTLDDAKSVARADEIRRKNDKYGSKTSISTRRIVKLEEISE